MLKGYMVRDGLGTPGVEEKRKEHFQSAEVTLK